ncbi:MAG: TonB-dependent hemoglobin/transferrin/lactoferrin family receptor [Rhodocyclales bacterium]|nr:TonB-dependent hemoglobin/transferrin/lactoferrin family receptor [Rhodocyclales bacterium]
MHSHTKRTLAVLVAAACNGVAASETALKETVVTATRQETAVEAVPATVTILGREALERRLPADETDLFRDEPDVALARDLRRFGATRINIRGIQDNRVAQMVDGVRAPDWYNGGGPTNFTMNAPLGASPDFLKRVEILRGPASSLYGSDAIGGVVGSLTLEPSDLIGGNERAGGRYRLGYTGANGGLANTLLGAWRGEAGEALLGYSRTDAREFDNKGDVDSSAATRTRPNPQDITDQGVLAKLGFKPAAGHRLSATLEGRKQDADVTIRRLSASLPKVTAMWGDDHGERLRASLEWEHKPAAAFYDRLTARLYHQQSDTENFNRQNRTNTSAGCSAASGAGNNCYVEQDFFFSQTATGGGAQFESAFKAWDKDHLLAYGVDLSRVKTDELRDARIWNQTTGSFTKSLAGENFPLRDFPIGNTDTLGLFVQDEIGGFASGALSLTPGLRYDWRKLTPEVDSLSQSVLTAIGRQAAAQTHSSLSPKLAALWRLTPAWSLYGQLVRGFRAPNYEEVNGSFRNTAQLYGVSPNPDLKPETSTGIELGAKLHSQALRGQLSVFDNRYRNFIESVRLNCPGDPGCIAGLNVTYMFQNLSRVRIYGTELRGAWDFAPGWRLDGALAYAHGDDESAGRPLDSVEPTRFSLGLAREAGAWGAEGRLRAAAKKNRVNDFSGSTFSPWFRPGGYGVVDLSAWWRPAKGAQINLAVHNLFDRKYWLWSDIRQADARNPLGVDFYSQPGRSLSASFAYQF